MSVLNNKKILNASKLSLILNRLASQLFEKHDDFSDVVLIGLQPRGTILSKKLKKLIQKNYSINNVDIGFLDVTFFRDDFGRGDKILHANKTAIDFIVEDKTVILIDDVLYTGRSIRAALSAIQSFGRPRKVELLTLIDRRFSRHLPIQPDYCGIQVDSINNQRLTVKWSEFDGEDAVYIFKKDGKKT
tara:strand:- start:638 stop:1201 length:564 start_codon:yes stop_codon:yes gene_type:complete